MKNLYSSIFNLLERSPSDNFKLKSVQFMRIFAIIVLLISLIVFACQKDRTAIGPAKFETVALNDTLTADSLFMTKPDTIGLDNN